MSKIQKTYRARTKVSEDTIVNVNINRDIDFLEILSLKIDTSKIYRLQASDRGIVIGRVLANGGFGIPNAKVSVFVSLSEEDNANTIITQYYQWTQATDMPAVDLQYNLLPDYAEDPCYRPVGTFPSKRVVLDNEDVLEVYDKYYKYTTATNNAGDYMIPGVPIGQQILHVDIDMSDIGILSQKPRDMFYKGYTMEQFENACVFKTDTNTANLAQIHSQNQTLQVYPLWGDKNTDILGISRCDINIAYKFEPTCVFMGSTMTDSAKNSISKYCTPSEDMGKIADMVTTEGTIEMIRKTFDERVEEFMIQGNRLIDKDGVFCYQIPMNLDYVTTNEFGEIVPSNNPNKGIATRCRVRFRFSLDIADTDSSNRHRAKYLVPNNPTLTHGWDESLITGVERDDSYIFGTNTNEEDFVDMFWNKVYSVKSYIPRLQRLIYSNTKYYTGLKATNYPDTNTPAPYNKIKVQTSARFIITCILTKIMVFAVAVINWIVSTFSLTKEDPDDDEEDGGGSLGCIPFIFDEESTVLYLPGCAPMTLIDASYNSHSILSLHPRWNWSCALFMAANGHPTQLGKTVITSNMYQNNYGYDYSQFTSIYVSDPINYKKRGTTLRLDNITPTTFIDGTSECIDNQNSNESIGLAGNRRNYFYHVRNKLVGNMDIMIDKIEQKLADSEEIIRFDFYNDWINGMLYFPLWQRYYRPKTNIFGLINIPERERFCECKKKRLISPPLRIFDSCVYPHSGDGTYIYGDKNKVESMNHTAFKQHRYALRYSIARQQINSGIIKKIKQKVNEKGDTLNVYYYTIGDMSRDGKHYVPLFTTDIINIGSFNENDADGFPQLFKYLPITSANIPPIGTMYVESTENESEEPVTTNMVEASGIDYGLRDPYNKSEETHSMMGNGLFVNLTCTTIYSNTKTCLNAQRISELGVGLDTTYDEVKDSSGTTLVRTKYADGLITQFDIVDPEVRSMFATMNNTGKQRTAYNEKTGYIVPIMSPIYFFAFDGMGSVGENGDTWLNGLTQNMSYHDIDPMDDEYMKFRFGTTGKQAVFYDETRKIPRYENSFYFYFGAKDGNTALDQFKLKYYADCEAKSGDNEPDEEDEEQQ